MKNTKHRIEKILKGVGLLVLVMTWPLFQAKAEYENYHLNDCNVLDQYDGQDGRASITLRQAVAKANINTRGDQRCRRSITIKTPVINLREPLKINVRHTDSDNLGGAAYYVIEGINPNGGRVTLNFDDYVPPSGSDPEKKCAIIFKNSTRNIILKGISIDGVNAGISGICFEGSSDASAQADAGEEAPNLTELGANNIVLENVRVGQVRGGHGIVIGDGANNIEIKSNSELDEISRDGLHILNINPLAQIKLDGTSRPVPASHETGADGTVVFGNATSPTDFVMKSIHGEVVSSASPVKVLVSQINDPNGDGKFTISGAVVNGNAACTNFVPQQDSNLAGQLEQRLERLQVYAVGLRSDSSGSKNAVFLTYVTKRADCVVGQTCANGLESSSNSSGSAGNQGGIFNFILDTNSYINRINTALMLNGAAQVTSIDTIVLVPELTDQSITSSKMITLSSGNSAPDLCEGQQGGGGGGSGYELVGSMTQDQCKGATGNYTHSVSQWFDSDGDGLSDFDEDWNHNCRCDPGEFSCWNDPDSDHDGILDGNELNDGQINGEHFNDNHTIDATKSFCDIGSGADAVDPCNVDSDTVSNAQDPESDGDTLDDKVEDRSRVFVASAKAYYYTWDTSLGSRVPYLNKEKIEVECTDRLRQAQRELVGAFYSVYKVKTDHSGAPALFHYLDDIDPASEAVIRLACINASAGLNSFNGHFDELESGETPVYSPTHTDSEGNLVNDDECRGTKRTVAGVDICELTCADYEIFSLLPAQYVTADRTELVKTNGVPNLYTDYRDRPQELLGLCPDIDGDGIPSCVESDTSLCSRMPTPSAIPGGSGAGGQNLNPYVKDTDGDNSVDGIAQGTERPDLCPFTRDSSANDGASCVARTQVYGSRPILSCFLDRDQDDLTDCQEDKDRDGSLDTVGGMDPAQAGQAPSGTDPRLMTESDPLSKDTDNDGIGDFVEVQSWNGYTNPGDPDTDGDGLPDGLEVRAYPGLDDTIDDAVTASPNRAYPDLGTQASGGVCTGFTPIDPSSDMTALIALGKTDDTRRFGTNPAKADTDGDGVKDGTEVRCADFTQALSALLANGFTREIDICSNPLSTDSDGDSLSDAREYARVPTGDGIAEDGAMQYYETSPCSGDTDGDGRSDTDDTSPTSRFGTATCTGISSTGPDADCDGEPNAAEEMLRTLPTHPDSDGDGLLDGEEDLNHDGRIDFSAGETNPTCQVLAGETPPDELHADPSCAGKDTDSDGLLDSTERVLTTNPAIADSDGDGIRDGIEMHFRQSPQITGDDTDPNNPDTDGDGMCDGSNNVTNGGAGGDVTCIRGEDLNNNGIRDVDARNGNRFTEFDPRTADSDGDGATDREEACRGGQCLTPDNIVAGNSGSNQGCFSLSATGSPVDPSSMLWIYGLLIMMNRLFTKRVKART